MARTFSWLFKLILILAGLALLLLLVLATLVVLRPDLSKPGLEELASTLGADLEIEHLEFKSNPVRLELKGVKLAGLGSKQSLAMAEVRIEPVLDWPGEDSPVFKLVQVKGLTATASPGAETSSHAPDPAPLAWIFLSEELEVLDWRLSWSQPGLNLSLIGPSLTLKPSQNGSRTLNAQATIGAQHSQGNLAGLIQISGVMQPGPLLSGSFKLADGAISGDALRSPIDLLMNFRLTPQGLHVPEMSASLPHIKLRPDPQGPSLTTSLHLDATVRGDLEGEALNIELTRLEMPQMIEAKGNLSFGAASGWRGSLHGKVPNINQAKQNLRAFLPKELEGLNISGALPFQAGLNQAGESLRISASTEMQGIEAAWPHQGLKARFKGPLELVLGSNGVPSIKGDLKVQGSYELEEFKAKTFNLNLPLDLDPARPKPQNFELTLPAQAIEVMGKGLGVGAMDLKGRFSWTIEPKFIFEVLNVDLRELGGFDGAWELKDGVLDGWFKGKEMPAAKFAALAEPWLGIKIADWEPAGTLQLKFKFYDLLNKPAMRVRVGSKGLGCSSPDGSILAQNLNPLFDILFSISDRPRLKASLSIKSGEALWDTLFVSFAKMPLNMELRGRMADPSSFDQLSVKGQLADWASFNFKGKLAHQTKGWRGQGEVEINSPDIKPLFITLLREPLAAGNPGIANLEPSGKINLKGKFKGPLEKLSISGHLDIQNASLKEQGSWPLFQGAQLSLPLTYQLGASQTVALTKKEVKKWGRLKLASLNLGGLNLGNIDLPLALVPNRLYVDGDLDIPILGGSLNISGIQMDNPLSTDYEGQLVAELKGVDLSQADLDGLPLQGNLGGKLEPVVLNSEGIKAEGQIKGGFMGGNLTVSGISLIRPQSPDRMVVADVDFQSLNLESLSQALDVGRVTGKISGFIKNLMIAYGQPQSFEMRLKSDPGSPFDQMVSLKAVNTIAVLGTGNSLTGIGVGLFASFFKQFPYETIGFSCTLKNDLFKVRGLILDDGVEYLVKRPFWGGINVVNRNQDNRITFSDMVERLKRVNQPAQAAEEES